MALPFAPGAAREILRASPEVTALVAADAISTRELPDPLTGPAVTIRAARTGVDNVKARRPRVMVSAWCPRAELLVDAGILTDPEELAWDIAAVCGDVLSVRALMGRGPSHTWRGASWRGELVEGPLTMVDVERGQDQPLYRAVVQVDLRMTQPA